MYFCRNCIKIHAIYPFFREEVVPEFWRNFNLPDDVDAKSAFDQFERAVSILHAKVTKQKLSLPKYLLWSKTCTQNNKG